MAIRVEWAKEPMQMNWFGSGQSQPDLFIIFVNKDNHHKTIDFYRDTVDRIFHYKLWINYLKHEYIQLYLEPGSDDHTQGLADNYIQKKIS